MFAAQAVTIKITESRHTLKKPYLEILDSTLGLVQNYQKENL